MTTPHVYIVQGVVVVGIPIDKEDFERGTGTRSVRSEDDCVFLRDVVVHGAQGRVSAHHVIVERREIAATGRSVVAPG